MNTAADKHTVSMHFVTAAVAHLDGEGRTRALATAGIAPHLLEIPAARVPANAFSALWLAIARELDDEFFGLDSRRMKVGSFALVAQAALSCTDVNRALKRILRGFSLFLDDVKAELSLESGEAVINVHNAIAQAKDRRFADETVLVLIHGLICWLAGRRIPLNSVRFAHPRPDHAREYLLMFCDEMVFGAPLTQVRFAGKALAVPVVQSAATLERFLQSAPQSVFLKYRNEESWTAQVRRSLRACVGSPDEWPRLEVVATQLRTTTTTLRRRLDGEGTTFQEIKDSLRNDIAIDHLCNSTFSVDEIAVKVGFQDASAFHRAFKRWNGLQPGEYRRLQLAGPGRGVSETST